MNKLILIITIVFSGMLMQAQKTAYITKTTKLDGVKYKKDTQLIVLDTLENNFYAVIIEGKQTSIDRWNVSLASPSQIKTSRNIVSQADKQADKQAKIERKEKGMVISIFESKGYKSVTYKKGNVYTTYVNGKLESTYTTYY